MNFTVRMTDQPDEAIRKAVLDPLVAHNRARMRKVFSASDEISS